MKKFPLKFKKVKLEKLIALVPYITLMASVFVIGYTAWYVYDTIIITSNDAVLLKDLQQNVVQSKLNIELFDEVTLEFLKKTEGSVLDFSNLRNPFEEVSLQKDAPPETPPDSPIDSPVNEESKEGA